MPGAGVMLAPIGFGGARNIRSGRSPPGRCVAEEPAFRWYIEEKAHFGALERRRGYRRTNHMRTDRFAISNVAGALIWVGMDCAAAYYLGRELARFAARIEIVFACLVLVAILVFTIVVSRYGRKLEADAERALPGSLEPPLGRAG